MQTIIENKTKNKEHKKNDLIRIANLMTKFGYEVIAIKNDKQFNQALTITVFPPKKIKTNFRKRNK